MRSMGSGLDTVSIQEVQLGLKAGFKAENIIFTPNGVSMNEIEKVASLGVQINIDNLKKSKILRNLFQTTTEQALVFDLLHIQ